MGMARGLGAPPCTCELSKTTATAWGLGGGARRAMTSTTDLGGGAPQATTWTAGFRSPT
jgi:hypothetical protein